MSLLEKPLLEDQHLSTEHLSTELNVLVTHVADISPLEYDSSRVVLAGKQRPLLPQLKKSLYQLLFLGPVPSTPKVEGFGQVFELRCRQQIQNLMDVMKL